MRMLEDRRLDVSGDDAREWLNGQLTCDLRELAPGSAKYGLLLSSKGKMISDVWVLEHAHDSSNGEQFSLVLPNSCADAAFERLDRFLVMEDVDLVFSDEVVVSIQGPGASAAFDGQEGQRWPVTRLDVEGAEVWLPRAEAKRVIEAMGGTSGIAFDDARIRAGVPAIGIDMGGDTLPQEVGLHSAVSFDKGCYVGQEPVVMLEHRGKPPKRLALLHLQNASVGDELTVDGKSAGRITSVHSSEPFALALIRRKHLEGEIRLGATPVESVTVIENALPRARE